MYFCHIVSWYTNTNKNITSIKINVAVTDISQSLKYTKVIIELDSEWNSAQ